MLIEDSDDRRDYELIPFLINVNGILVKGWWDDRESLVFIIIPKTGYTTVRGGVTNLHRAKHITEELANQTTRVLRKEK